MRFELPPIPALLADAWQASLPYLPVLAVAVVALGWWWARGRARSRRSAAATARRRAALQPAMPVRVRVRAGTQPAVTVRPVPVTVPVPVAAAEVPAEPLAAVAPAAPATPQPVIPPRRPALLLVDDSAVVRAKLRKLFEGAGYRVALACDGQEALPMLRGGAFDLLITDVEMPRMGGLELAERLKLDSRTAHLPVIAVTGNEELRAGIDATRLGLADVFRKPWVDHELVARAALLVAARAPAGVPAARERVAHA